MSLPQIWTTFQTVHLPFSQPNPSPLRFDNPFLVHYVLYHHYRSLGWVVRTGIKFCVDYLLYKRGPVFHHAEYVLYEYRSIDVRTHSPSVGSQSCCVRCTRMKKTGYIHRSI